MFDPLIDAVAVVGPSKEVYYCNDSFVSLFDLPRKQIESGSPIYDMLTFDDPELLISKEGEKGKTEQTGYLEVGFKSKSGKSGLVQVCILPTQELFGRNKLWFVYFHDVSLEDRLHRKYVRQTKEKEKVLGQLEAIQSGGQALEKEPSGQGDRLNQVIGALTEVSSKLEAGLKAGELGEASISEAVNQVKRCISTLSSVRR